MTAQLYWPLKFLNMQSRPTHLERSPAAQYSARRVGRLVFFPTAITLALWALRTNDVTLSSVICAAILAAFASTAYFDWRHGSPSSSSTLLFALVAGMYWLSFALPLFWGRTSIQTIGGPREVPADAIDRAMF